MTREKSLRKLLDQLRSAEFFAHGLEVLTDLGFRPSVYRRGSLWRVHTEVFGSNWHDGRTLITALKGAIRCQIKSDKASRV